MSMSMQSAAQRMSCGSSSFTILVRVAEETSNSSNNTADAFSAAAR
jgi:hypothetical protein